MSRLSEAIQEADRCIKDVLLQQKQVEVLLDTICKKYGIKSFMTLNEFYKLRTIDSYLPLKFGKCSFESFDSFCGSCDKIVNGDSLRGTIEPRYDFGYREFRIASYQLEATAYCKACDKITTLSYVLFNDLSIAGISPHTGKWSHWKAENVKPTILQRVKKWFWKQRAKPNELSI